MSSNLEKYLKYKKKYLNLKKIYGGKNTEVVKFNNDMYIGMKELPYKKKDGIEYDNVYFVFERLTDKNYMFWYEYVNKQPSGARFNNENSIMIPLIDGKSAFKYSLELFEKSKRKEYSIWIAYATRINPYISKYIPDDDIEMTFTVFADRISPITTHMGIFRNYQYFASSKFPHKNLSMELHGFAGKASKLKYPQIEYMVTRPVEKMQEIMKNKLQNTGEIWVGSTRERKIRKQSTDNFEHNKSLLETYNNKKESLTVNNLNKFLSIRPRNKENIKKKFNIASNHTNHTNSFIYNEITKLHKDRFVNTRISRIFYPVNIMPPLNNSDENTWFIRDIDDIIEFRRPGWFGQEGHPDLMYTRFNRRLVKVITFIFE